MDCFTNKERIDRLAIENHPVMKKQEIMLYLYEYIFELLFLMTKTIPIIKPRSIKVVPKHIRDVIRYQWI